MVIWNYEKKQDKNFNGFASKRVILKTVKLNFKMEKFKNCGEHVFYHFIRFYSYRSHSYSWSSRGLEIPVFEIPSFEKNISYLVRLILILLYFLRLEKSCISPWKSISGRIRDEKEPNKIIKVNQFKHDKMDFVLQQEMT